MRQISPILLERHAFASEHSHCTDMSVQAAADQELCGLINNLLIGRVADLPRIPFLGQRSPPRMHLQSIGFNLREALAEEKATVPAKVTTLVFAFGLSAKSPNVWPKHFLDRLRGPHIQLSAESRYQTALIWRGKLHCVAAQNQPCLPEAIESRMRWMLGMSCSRLWRVAIVRARSATRRASLARSEETCTTAWLASETTRPSG